ncbi:MAG TPA: NADH-quinone oxidoreductase subunit J [Chloroflexia bacterium]|nr:NADH-quinone oxidoreductase subunit J [Chloroflexia bacterium]
MTIPIPSIAEVVFLVLSAVAIVAGLMMITRQDAVHSALWLVVVLFQLAGLYVLLNAPFLAVLQVLVYAGAILVLFLFVIMLLQLREGPQLGNVHQIQRVAAWPIGALLAVELVIVIALASGLHAPALPAGVAMHVPTAPQAVPAATPLPAGSGSTAFNNPGGGWPVEEVALYNGEPRALGIELYTNFLWPFEIASFILLVAVIGAIVLARREEPIPAEVETRGISLARGAYPGSPQAAEIGKVLAGQVPGVHVVQRDLAGDAPAPPFPHVTGLPGDAPRPPADPPAGPQA